MHKRIINNTKDYFKNTKRNTAELKEKMQQLFEDNVADYDKFASWYSKDSLVKIGNQLEYEHYVIENYKKTVFGDSYAIKEYKPYY